MANERPRKYTATERALSALPAMTPEQKRQMADIYRTFRRHFARKKRKGKLEEGESHE